MKNRRQLLSTFSAYLGAVTAAVVATGSARRAHAQDAKEPAPGGKPAAAAPLFALELRTGPAWDHAKPAHEQLHFREHSASLRRLRDEGTLVLGARYADKGFMVLSGASIAAVREQIELDPAVRNGIFAFELNEFRVFYSGCVATPARRS